ncbi:GH39 family glycosyl hydrolase [Kribbella sp. WER1]
MIGGERLSQLLCKDLTGADEIGVELEDALRRMHDDVVRPPARPGPGARPAPRRPVRPGRVLTWDFKVWNEANLEVFWSGTKAEYLHLYDVSAAALKSVDPRLQVGGPSSAAAGRIDALSYWVASDHFGELSRPPRFLHGGFGLQTVGGLRKPRYHALTPLSRLGPVELPVAYDGDGGGSLVEAWASRDRDRIAVLLWNLTLDQTKADGDPALTRTVRVQLPGADPSWQLSTTTLAIGTADLATAAAGLADWPTDVELADLAERTKLVTTAAEWNGSAVGLTLPMPSAVLLELRPARDSPSR